MLPLIIVNPRSAGGSTRESWSGTASDLRAHFGAYNVAFTKAAGDGVNLARNAADAGREFIIACGGDGTINEVANGILQSGKDIELGVLPSGTGGDFRRSLGMPQSPRDAARALRDGATKRIDAGRVTFQGHAGETITRFFLNVSSFGLAASIIERVKSNKALDWLPLGGVRGRANFALSTLSEVVGLDAVTVKVRIDSGEEKLLQTVNFCVANARYFGGGMMIAPNAKLDDGKLDIVNIGDIRTAKVLLNAYTLYNGSHLDLAEVKSTLARRIEIAPASLGDDIHIETDGELPGRLPAVYEIVPAALRVRVPRDQA
ncbi:MAG: diacylglycerol kinase family lipid kinase [Acidobacteria bacterium]|nr:diacylglycerol kinase family lipid kinase [Acidobacteriota bacterium]